MRHGVKGCTQWRLRPDSSRTTGALGMTALSEPSPGLGPHWPCFMLSAADASASFAF